MNKELRDTYNRIAEDWSRDHADDDWWIEGTNKFLSLLPANGSVLDVGCGAGNKAKYMADRGFHVLGIDFSEELLKIARAEALATKFRNVAMEELDSITEQFDGVFAQASLLHIPKAEAEDIVKKMAARVNDGGHLYIAVKEIREGNPEEEINKENDYGYNYERFFSYFIIPELESYLQNAGLEVVWSVRNPNPSGKTVWLQIIGKK